MNTEEKKNVAEYKLVIYEQIILDSETLWGLFTLARITRGISLSLSLSLFCKAL